MKKKKLKRDLATMESYAGELEDEAIILRRAIRTFTKECDNLRLANRSWKRAEDAQKNDTDHIVARNNKLESRIHELRLVNAQLREVDLKSRLDRLCAKLAESNKVCTKLHARVAELPRVREERDTAILKLDEYLADHDTYYEDLTARITALIKAICYPRQQRFGHTGSDYDTWVKLCEDAGIVVRNGWCRDGTEAPDAVASAPRKGAL